MIKRLYIAIYSSTVYLLASLLFLFTPGLTSADVIVGWQSAQDLNTNLASHSSIGILNKLFVMGGSTNDDYSDVRESTVDQSGTLSVWSTSSNLPDTRYWGAVSGYGDRVYFLGGTKFTGFGTENNTVFSSIVNNQGSLASWQTLNPMPGTRAMGNSVIVNNRIYYAGGFNPAGRHDEIFYADINNDGTLGSWTTSSVSLPTALYGFGMIENDGNIYILGGANASNVYQSKVYKSFVNVDGSLSSWTQVTSLPEAIFRSSYIKVGNKIVAVGGQNASKHSMAKVYYSEINPDGSLGSWVQSVNSLPSPVDGASVAQVGDYLYLTGGFNTFTSSYLNSVYYAKIDNSVALDVPLFTQTSTPWNDDIYDTASLWTTDTTFARWGCAVTSAAMVFGYHGLDQISNSLDLNPGTLNDWLKSQPDGYIGNGNTNWIALSRLSKQISGLNGVTFDALEFNRFLADNHQVVKDQIDSNNPTILREPGHFVVGRGYDDSTILINDPFYDRNNLSQYSNTFQNVSTFTPSNTDLSYMMFVLTDGLEIKVYDENNNEIGILIEEDPILDPSGEASTSAQPLSVVYVQKPADGSYRVEIGSTFPQNYVLNAYFYDQDANVKKFNLENETISSPDIYVINFDKQEVNSATIELELEVSYDSLLEDINKLYSEKKLKLGEYISLSVKTKLAKSFSKNNKMELRMLSNLKSEVLKQYRTRKISIETRDYLIKRIDVLIEDI